MSITDKQLKTFARLARLEFSQEELSGFKGELVEMIEFCDTINQTVEGDTASIREIGSQTTDLDNLREDCVAPSLENEKILSNVRGEKGYFAVKRVVK